MMCDLCGVVVLAMILAIGFGCGYLFGREK